jgi:hypothetical protein
MWLFLPFPLWYIPPAELMPGANPLPIPASDLLLIRNFRPSSQ